MTLDEGPDMLVDTVVCRAGSAFTPETLHNVKNSCPLLVIKGLKK